MENLTIRSAAPADLAALLEFEQCIIEFERPFDETIKRGSINYYDLPALLASENAEVVAADLDGRVIGSGYARIEKAKPYSDHTSYSYLGFMYVVPEYRGKGVNRLIVDALFDWSLGRGVREVRLEVYSANTAAIRAYEKAGFAAGLVTMRTRLGGSGAE